MHFQMWMIPVGYAFFGFLAMAWISWEIGKHIAEAHFGDPKSPCTNNKWGCDYQLRHLMTCVVSLFWPVFVAYIPFFLWSTFWRNAGMNSNLPPLNSRPMKTESDSDCHRRPGPEGIPGYQGSSPRGLDGVGGWQATRCRYCGAQNKPLPTH